MSAGAAYHRHRPVRGSRSASPKAENKLSRGHLKQRDASIMPRSCLHRFAHGSSAERVAWASAPPPRAQQGHERGSVDDSRVAQGCAECVKAFSDGLGSGNDKLIVSDRAFNNLCGAAQPGQHRPLLVPGSLPKQCTQQLVTPVSPQPRGTTFTQRHVANTVSKRMNSKSCCDNGSSSRTGRRCRQQVWLHVNVAIGILRDGLFGWGMVQNLASGRVLLAVPYASTLHLDQCACRDKGAATHPSSGVQNAVTALSQACAGTRGWRKSEVAVHVLVRVVRSWRAGAFPRLWCDVTRARRRC